MFKLSHIYLYPIKSLYGFSCTSAELGVRGIKHDRRWMLVDESGRFVSQREYPQMAQLGTQFINDQLWIYQRNELSDRIAVPMEVSSLPERRLDVQVWDDVCSAQLVSKVCDAWISEQLGANLRLVYMPDDSLRATDPKYVGGGQYVGLADAYPYLIIGQSSLDELNRRLPYPILMNRFRPNFVFTGGVPHIEDTWSNFKIGNASFEGIKPCGRCMITTIDQSDSTRSAEPLKTLATYRQSGHKIIFGQNTIWTGQVPQTVSVGDEIYINQ